MKERNDKRNDGKFRDKKGGNMEVVESICVCAPEGKTEVKTMRKKRAQHMMGVIILGHQHHVKAISCPTDAL